MSIQQSEHLKSLGLIATSIAHELHQPLSFLRAVFEQCLESISLGRQLDTDTMKDKLRQVLSQVSKMEHIINHIHLFNAHHEYSRLGPVKVNDILLSATVLLEDQLSKKNIQLVLDLTDNIPDITIHPFSLESAINNLISNARDACEKRTQGCRPQARIILRTRHMENKKSAGVVIQVVDNGCGIPEHMISKIFDPFFSTKDDRGIGIGLTITRSIIEKFKGTITITSNMDDGTIVTLCFPESGT